jgi:hypothetical protein
MRARKQHTRREIKSYKPDVKKLLKFGTELDLMQYLRGIEIFDEDPPVRAGCERLPDAEERETLAAKACNSLRFARATVGGRVSSCSWIIFATISVALSSFDFLLAIGTTE